MKSKAFVHKFIKLSFLAMIPLCNARTFTDDTGRQVDAEIIGLRGDNVVISVNGIRGQWPVAKLSAPDRAFVSEWKASHSGVTRIGIRSFEQDGIGEKGSFPEATNTEPKPPINLPIGPRVETKAAYKHYTVELNNPATLDAAHLQAEYVIYVIAADGTVRANAARQSVPTIPASKSTKVITEGATAAKTKATKLKIAFSNNNLSTTEKTERSKDKFGGIWVKIYNVEGNVIGEEKHLTPELEKLSPAWEEVATKEEIPVIKSFAAFLELIKKGLPPRPPIPN